jgi:glycosyltransferase involved in cell wall biosynthesis
MALDRGRFSINSLEENSKSPKVSIGMPVHNGEKFIHRALDSLLNQTFTDFELIISDNASTDGTRQICLEYAARDRRIRYYRNDVIIQPIPNFNRVLSYAKGQYFMWAAHDDKWETSFVENLAKSLDHNPQAVLSFCRFTNVDDDGQSTRTFKEDWKKVFSRSKFWQFVFMTLSDELVTQKANHIYGLMRRDILLKYGGMLLIHWEFVIVDQVLFHYRARSHTTYRGEPLGEYLWQRITQHKTGHQGNLLLFFTRNHAYHANMRKLIVKGSSLRPIEKVLLWLAIVFKEVWFPIRFLPVGILRELRILR